MDDARPKCTKITIRAEFEDGRTAELEAVEPENVAYETAYPEPDYDLSRPTHLVSVQPSPTVTLRFTASRKHGITEHLAVDQEVAATWTSMFLPTTSDDALSWIARADE